MSKAFNALKAAVGLGKPSPFVHVESELAALLGVAQDLVKDQRQALTLTRGSDWELVKSAVTYTEEAAKKILAGLSQAEPGPTAPPPATADLAPNSAPPADPAPSPAPTLPAVPAPAIAALVCVKLPRNRRIILARAAADKTAPLVRVRVKDSTNFSPGMELEARHLTEDLYVLEGRAPRATS